MAEKKSIHEFSTGTPQAQTAFVVDTPSPSAESGYVTEKVITSDLGNTLLGTLNYTQSLDTESKNIFGAVNELKENSVNFEEEAIPDIPERELPYYPSGEYSSLNTTDKHIVGAINEVNSEKANKSDVQRITTTNIEVTPEANSYVQPFTYYKEVDITSYLSGKKIIGVLLMTGQTTDPLGYNYNEPMLRIYASKGNKVTVKLILIS